MDLSWNYNLCYVTKLGLLQICFILRIDCEIKKKLHGGILSQGHVKKLLLSYQFDSHQFLSDPQYGGFQAGFSFFACPVGVNNGPRIWFSTLDFHFIWGSRLQYIPCVHLHIWKRMSFGELKMFVIHFCLSLKKPHWYTAKLAKKSLIFVVRFFDQPCERTLSHLSPIVLILDSSGRRIFAY